MILFGKIKYNTGKYKCQCIPLIDIKQNNSFLSVPCKEALLVIIVEIKRKGLVL